MDDKENNMKFSTKDLRTLFELNETTSSTTHDSLKCKKCVPVSEWKKIRSKEKEEDGTESADSRVESEAGNSKINDEEQLEKVKMLLDQILSTSAGKTLEYFDIPTLDASSVKKKIGLKGVKMKLEGKAKTKYANAEAVRKDIRYILTVAQGKDPNAQEDAKKPMDGDVTSLDSKDTEADTESATGSSPAKAAPPVSPIQEAAATLEQSIDTFFLKALGASFGCSASAAAPLADDDDGIELDIDDRASWKPPKQVSLPNEEDLKNWGHNYDYSSVDDPVMRKALQACSDPHLVSFVFTCEIDPEIMAKRMELDKVEDEKRMRGRKMKLEELHQRKKQMCKQETERIGNSDDDASNSDDDNQVDEDPREMDDFIVQDGDAESDSGGGEEPDACAPSSRNVDRKKEGSRNKKPQKGKKMIEFLDSDSDSTDSDLNTIDAGLKQCKKAKKIPTNKVVVNQTESSNVEYEDLGIAEEDETERVIRELQEEGWGTRRSSRERRNTARFVDGRENNPYKKSPKRQKVGDNSDDKSDITTSPQKVPKHKTRFPQDSLISSSHQMEDSNVEVEPKKKHKGKLSLKKNRDSNAPSMWKCPLCTFQNPWKNKTCKVCREGRRALSQAGSEDNNSTGSGDQAPPNSTEQIENSAVTANGSIVESFDSRAPPDDDKTDDGDNDPGTSNFSK